MTRRLDLTKGAILTQLIRLAAPILLSMLMFTLYMLIDLYFVGRLGPDAVTALSISSNIFFIHLGFSFIIGTGAMALIAQAFGAGNYQAASQIFWQSILLSLIAGIFAAGICYTLAHPYIRFFGGQGPALNWGVEYFKIYSISILFLLLLHVFGSCYRGMGDTKTPMFIILQTLGLNIILDPILIFGYLGMPAMGVKGAALASLISQVYGVTIFGYLVFFKKQHVELKGPWSLDIKLIRKSLSIGLPSGLAYFLLTANLLITYRVVSPYGTEVLASLGIGFRVVQSIYLPTVALSEAMAAMTGQNYGAGDLPRVYSTFWTGWRISMILMIIGTCICCLFPSFFIEVFSKDPEVVTYGVMYLRIISLANVAVGTLLTVSSIFQGIGRTYPSLVCALMDNLLFALLVFTLPAFFGWGLSSVWWIKLFTAFFEMCVCAAWLGLTLKKIYPTKVQYVRQ